MALGQPALKIRAIDEKDRNRSQPIECATYKQGTSIYLEPRIIGKGLEAFSRFRHATTAKAEKVDSPAHITITASNGKQLLSKNLEYG